MAPKTAAQAPNQKAAAPKAAANTHNGVYVKNWGTGSVADAIAIFSKAGKVVSAQVRRHKYALVFFESAAGVKKAIDEFNEKVVLGAKVTVAPAHTAPRADATEGSSTVFIGPIMRGNTTRAQVRELLASYKVKALHTYRQNYALVHLDSNATAKKLIAEKNGSDFRGHKLICKLSCQSIDRVKAHAERSRLLIKAHQAAAKH